MGCTDVTTLQVPMHNFVLYSLFEKVGMRETWPCFTCGACKFPSCLWRLKSRTVLTLRYSLFSFPDTILEFWNFCTKRQSFSDSSLDHSSGICFLTKGFWMTLNFLFYGLYEELWVGKVWDSLVPHDIVEPKTRSKKKLVMQLDRDVQVCGIYLFAFLNTRCFEILLLLLFWRGGHVSLFSMLFDWRTFFLCLLSIYFFSMTPLSFLKNTRREISLYFGRFIFLDGWHVLHNSRCRN
jgi:hypothetical protein